MSKLYKNGRVAVELDPVVGLSAKGIITAGVIQLDPKPDATTGIVHVQIPATAACPVSTVSTVEARIVNVADMHHAEDALAMIAEVSKVKAAVAAATDAGHQAGSPS